MLSTNVVTQPAGKTNLEVLSEIAQSLDFNRLDVAAAYVTSGGARDLIGKLKGSMGPRWGLMRKRWIFAFDYCRSEPLALEMILAEPRSTVRIFNGSNLLATSCVPRTPFHPKAFLFEGANGQSLFAGSGNISRSGLNKGHEVGLLLGFKDPADPSDTLVRGHIQRVRQWYDAVWRDSDQLTLQLLSDYRKIYTSQENHHRPTPTEDDIAPSLTTRGLTPKQLIKLRVCTHFWIEAGNVTKNLGRRVPGNQLMMKRLSRVFFGVPAADVSRNSPLTKIAITYNGVTKSDCSLTFSDNGMDKLTLPLPGSGGPTAYDGETLLFTRVGAGVFELETTTAARKRACILTSKSIDALYSMGSPGRQWGVF